MRDAFFLGLIAAIAAGCSSQPGQIAAGPSDDGRSTEIAAFEKARFARFVKQNYPVCARSDPQRRLLDLSIDPRPIPADIVNNRVRLDRSGAPVWNGAPIDLAQLRQFLDIATTMTPQPLLVVEVDKGAPKQSVQALREAIIRSDICPSLVAT
jgi:hypothetical protein